jgi:threonine dehydrogenase-like Zn-dependent dehydrogenase
MSRTTKAAVLTGARKMELRELSVPDITDDAGLLRVEITGVCGVDWPAYTQVRGDRFIPPLILGHEIVGRIEKLGAAAAQKWGVQEGDRVVLEEYVPCGNCRYCLSGAYNLCGGMMMKKMYGFTSMNVGTGLWGGFSEYVYLDPNSRLHRIADHVPSHVAPLYIPISNGIRWVQTEAQIGIGDTVAILGPGQLGLACTIAAKEAGARRIIVSGRSTDAKRFEVARAFGATDIIDVDKEDLHERINEITGGELVDAVINVTAAAPMTPQQSLEIAKIRGRIVMTGGAFKPALNFNSDMISRKELTLIGVRGRTERDVKRALQIVESGKYPLEKFATHKFAIETAESAVLTVGGEGEKNAIHVSVLAQ